MPKNKNMEVISMKKYISIALAVLLAIAALTGCATKSKPADNGDNGKISIVATIFPPYDFAREIIGDKADITMLLRVGAEPHSYDPTPQDIIKIQDCDVFIYVGGESDEWVNGVLDSMDTGKMKIVTLMDCVEVVEEEVVEGMEEEEDEPADADEPEYDEHVWTSPRGAKLIVQKLSDTFCAVDPTNADTYKANTASYLEKLDELDGKFQAVVDNAARKTIVVGDRFPFRYLTDAYGLTYFAAFPGCGAETEASAQTVKFLIDKIKEERIPVVLYVSNGNGKMADSIAEETGAKVLPMQSCELIAASDFNAGKGYIELMTANVDALREALK
jgi:zinc transport system substrate-binding protein